MTAFEHQQGPTRSGEPVRAAKADRTVSRPPHADNPLLEGQRALGNQVVQRLLLSGVLQAKLRVGQPNDAYEQEADRVSETVMRMPEPEVRRQRTEEGEEEEEEIRTEPLAEGIMPLVQRQTEAPPEEEEEEEEPPEAAPGEVQPLVQRQEAEPPEEEEEEEEPQGVQRKAKGADITHVRDAALVQRLRSPSGGSPLSGCVRSFFERRFGYDFSEVRIHDTYRDRADAASLGARAFTYGKHIWLGESESASDSRLMAHELTHVVQQNAGVGRRPLGVSQVSPRIQRGWWDRVKETVGGAISTIGELAGDAKAAVLGKLAQWAKRIPGFDLLTVILGKDPISDQPVERNATNLIKGVLGLLGPPGLTMFENLQRAKAIDRAFEWLDQEIARLNLTWEAIKGLFRTAWDSLSLSDVLNLSNAIAKVAQIFGPTLSRLVNFASTVGQKILEFIFEGVLNSLSGTLGTRVLAIVRRAGAVFSTIIKDPIKFIGNLVAAVRGGFERFSENILDHLRTALMQWLFGALSGAGLTLPDRFDLRGIISIVLQVLGLTYDRLRGKLVGLIGEKNVARIEGVFDFLRTIVTGGLGAAWEKILEFVENLQEMVIGGIREWVANSVVGAAIKKLVTMFNPAGAIIQAIMAIYNTVLFFIERAQQIAALAEAVFDSISNIAAGNVGAAISYVERTMARALPVVIGFLARLIGLGNVGDNIREIIKKVQAPVERAIDKVAGFVVQRARGLFGRDDERAAPGEMAPGSEVATFEADGVQHRLWTVEKDGAAVVMVASQEQPLEGLLKSLETQAQGKPESLSKLEEARTLATETKSDYAQTLSAIRKAQTAQMRKKSAEVLTDQQRLGRLLSNILSELHLVEDDAPTGESDDPIPIIWWKDFGQYPSIAFEDQAGSSQRLTRTSGGKIPTHPNPLGVSDEFVPKAGQTVWQKSTAQRGPLVKVLMAALRQLPKLEIDGMGPTGNWTLDHVKDVEGWGGPDREENLWPLDWPRNAKANAVHEQWVFLKDKDGTVRPTQVKNLRGKYFYVFAVKDGAQLSNSVDHGTARNLPVNNGKVAVQGVIVPKRRSG